MRGHPLGSLVLLILSVCVSADVWYVDDDTPTVPVGQDGMTWATAFDNIQEAVDEAFFDGGGEVWVATGTYAVSDVSPLQTPSVVTMCENVHIYGGFIGNGPGGFETSREQRDWTRIVTVIDGEMMRGCVQGANGATLDGFTLTNGRGIGYPSLTYGGGICNVGVSPTVANCVFVGNDVGEGFGGAICNVQSTAAISNCVFVANAGFIGAGILNTQSSSPTITNCVFMGHVSTQQGAAMCNQSGSSPTVRNCAFVGNRSRYSYGGGMYNTSSSPVVANCLFVGNYSRDGGGMSNKGSSSPIITNCTFDQNLSADYGGICNYSGAAPTVTNCIIWGSAPAGIYDDPDSSASVSYSDVQGGYAGEGNFNPSRNPRFMRGPSGTSTGLAFDSWSFKSMLHQDGAGFTPAAFVGAVLWIAGPTEDSAYLIIDNDTEWISVWGDATQGGSLAAPVDYAVIDYHLAKDSPCVDAGRDTSSAEYGFVTDDIVGAPRGQDGALDGPTGPPPPGDGCDYDMGAYETPHPFAAADVDHSGSVNAIDVQLVINAALELEVPVDCDINGDGIVNAVDVQMVINAALELW